MNAWTALADIVETLGWVAVALIFFSNFWENVGARIAKRCPECNKAEEE